MELPELNDAFFETKILQFADMLDSVLKLDNNNDDNSHNISAVSADVVTSAQQDKDDESSISSRSVSSDLDIYLDSSESTTPSPLTTVAPLPVTTTVGSFQVDDRLEAIDRRYPNLICVAHIEAINENGDLYICFDGWSSLYNYWSRAPHSDLACVGTCDELGLVLQPPKASSPSTFNWESYLNRIHARAAPSDCFPTKGFRDSFATIERRKTAVTSSTQTEQHNTQTCHICFEPWERSNLTFPCATPEHAFCQGCLRQYANRSVECGWGNSIRCPMAFECGSVIAQETIGQLLVEPHRSLWQTQIANSTSQTAWHIRCPRPNCGMPLAIDDIKDLSNIRCLACSQTAHFSKSQRVACRKIVSNSHLSDLEKHDKVYELLNTKPCPRCGVRIERDGGCDHMTCNKCSAYFCWQCGSIMHRSSFLLLGKHSDRYQLNGCAETFIPENRALCYSIRGGLFAGKMTALAVLGPPVLVGGTLFYLIPTATYRGIRKIARR